MGKNTCAILCSKAVLESFEVSEGVDSWTGVEACCSSVCESSGTIMIFEGENW